MTGHWTLTGPGLYNTILIVQQPISILLYRIHTAVAAAASGSRLLTLLLIFYSADAHYFILPRRGNPLIPISFGSSRLSFFKLLPIHLFILLFFFSSSSFCSFSFAHSPFPSFSTLADCLGQWLTATVGGLTRPFCLRGSVCVQIGRDNSCNNSKHDDSIYRRFLVIFLGIQTSFID